MSLSDSIAGSKNDAADPELIFDSRKLPPQNLHPHPVFVGVLGNRRSMAALRARSERRTPPQQWSSLGVLNAYPRVLGEMPPPVLPHLWTVAVGLQGYVVLGLVALVCRRVGGSPSVMLGVLLIVAWMMCAHDAGLPVLRNYYAVYWLPHYRLEGILMAAALAAGHAEGRISFEQLPLWTVPLVVGLLLQLNAVPDPIEYSFGSGLLALSSAQLTTLDPRAAAHSTWTTRARETPWLTDFDAASYSIYLWQQIFYARQWMLPWPPALALAVATGFAAHYLLDHKLPKATVRSLDLRRSRSSARPT